MLNKGKVLVNRLTMDFVGYEFKNGDYSYDIISNVLSISHKNKVLEEIPLKEDCPNP